MKKKNDQALRLNYALARLGSAKERRLGWAFTSEPKNVEEERLGSLFLVGEIDPEGDDEVPPVLSLVGSQIKQAYYAKPQRRALASFTESLRKGNTIFSHVPKKRNPMWLGRVHLGCGSFADGMLHFTLIGKIRAFLFRGALTVDLSRRFLPEGRPHPTRLFHHIASGTLAPGDRLFFATPKIFTTLYVEDIRHIIRDVPFTEIPREIELLYQQKEARGALYLIAAEVLSGLPASAPPQRERWFQEVPQVPPWRKALEAISAGLTANIIRPLKKTEVRGVLRRARRALDEFVPSIRRIERRFKRYGRLGVVIAILTAAVIILAFVFRREIIL